MHDIEKSQELAKQEEKFAIKKALDELAKGQDELSRRLADLEEKERQRSRDEHQKDLSFDEQAMRDGRFYDDRLDER